MRTCACQVVALAKTGGACVRKTLNSVNNTLMSSRGVIFVKRRRGDPFEKNECLIYSFGKSGYKIKHGLNT